MTIQKVYALYVTFNKIFKILMNIHSQVYHEDECYVGGMQVPQMGAFYFPFI